MHTTRWPRRGCLAVVLAFLAAILLPWLALAPPSVGRPGADYNRGANAAWLQVEWVMDAPQPDQIAGLARDLERHQIRTVYVYTSYLKAEGAFNPTYDHAAEFVRIFKSASPATEIQAWIGLPLAPTSQFSAGGGYVRLDDPDTRQRIVAFCAQMVAEAGYDGVHIDPEPVNSEDPALLSLLDEVRAAIGPHAVLSVAGKRIRPILPESTLPLMGHLAWSATYYRAVAARVDQVAVMIYDSALPLAGLYRLWCRWQVIQLSQALDTTDAEVLIGVPTSEERSLTHRPCAENMRAGVLGVLDGLNDPRSRPFNFTGLAIYPYWETDEAEWRTYARLWLGQEPQENGE